MKSTRLALRPARSGTRPGFTLAEVAVTIAVVGLALVWMLQALHAVKLTALHTRNMKLAKDLALLTLGQIEAGLYVDELSDERLEGNYAEEGFPDFLFEAILGDDSFRPEEGTEAFDNWATERSQKEAELDPSEEPPEEPYERIQIKVSFPKFEEFKNEVVFERWLPWDQVYPKTESELEAAAKEQAP